MLEKYDQLCALFIDNMRSNHLSNNSVDSYSRTFRFFRETLVSGGYTEACPGAVASFKSDRPGVSLKTISLYLTHLRLLSQFGLDMGLIEESFVPNSLMPPKKMLANERKKEYDHVLTEEQIIKLLAAQGPLKGRKPRTWLREKAETVIFLQSGLRNSELRALTPADLDFASGLIHAREAKGDKPRLVLFPAQAQQAVKDYLSSGLRPETASDTEPLFGCVDRAAGSWKALDRAQLSALIDNHVSSILGVGCRTHALRHAYASLLLEHDAPIQFISETLGHSNISTTTIYAQRLNPSVPAQALGNIFSSLLPNAAECPA